MSRIPKILHYCFGLTADFGGKPWSLANYVSVASAIEKIKPDMTYFYCQFEPSGSWWELTKPMVTLVSIVAPEEVFGNPLTHVAHKADVVRLEKIIEHGGIYLDSDVVVQRSLDDLLDFPCVMGQEGLGGKFGLANAVLLAEPQSSFMIRWYENYRNFRGAEGSFWSEHSVELPGRMATEYPNEIHVLPHTAFFWPLWTDEGQSQLFESGEELAIDLCYANHLWASQAWDHLKNLTPGKVRARNTNFNRWARPYLHGLDDSFGDRTLAEKSKRIVNGVKRRVSMASLRERLTKSSS